MELKLGNRVRFINDKWFRNKEFVVCGWHKKPVPEDNYEGAVWIYPIDMSMPPFECWVDYLVKDEFTSRVSDILCQT